MLAAPLLAGNNLSQLSPDTSAFLTNCEIIAIDQDPLGKGADRIYAEGPIEIWARPLADGSRAFAIFNFGEQLSYLRGMSLHLEESRGGKWLACSRRMDGERAWPYIQFHAVHNSTTWLYHSAPLEVAR